MKKTELDHALQNEHVKVKLLARSTGESELTIRRYLDGALDRSERRRVDAKVKAALALSPPTAPPPDAAAKKAAAHGLDTARRVLTQAAADCREAGAGEVCQTIDQAAGQVSESLRMLEQSGSDSAEDDERNTEE